jgi:transposase
MDPSHREAIVAHLKEQLRSGDKSLVGNKGYRRYLKVEGSGHFVIDEKQVKAEERYDGIWVLRTNTVYNTETVAHVYKALWTVEDIIRTSKSIFETRPIYHKRDETIRGHVFCSFLALLLKQELENRMKRTDLQWEWKEVLRGLDALQQLEANLQGRRFLFPQPTADASQAVRATSVALPPTLRELQRGGPGQKCSAKRL